MRNPVATHIRLFLLGILVAVSDPCTAGERRWTAEELFATAVTTDVRLSDDKTTIELDRGELIEDDGPAAGYSYRPNEEILSDSVRVKKVLVVDDPRADAAVLLVGSGGTLKFDVNGQPRRLDPLGKAGNYWHTFALPPDLLKPGQNEFVLHGSGKIWIARDDEFAAGSRTRTTHPNRSAKSTDGGRTWDFERLGPKGDIDGEYYVRVFLDRYRPSGSLVLPVLDVSSVGRVSGTSNKDERERVAAQVISPRLESIGSIRLRLQADTDVKIRVRSGRTPIPTADGWTDWKDIGRGAAIEKPAGRYFQIALDLKTDDPLRSPQLKQLVVETEPVSVTDDWAANLTVVEHENAEIVRTSIPFKYEPFDHPRLKKLREQYLLDRLTSGAASELELIRRLAAWSATQWTKGHLGKAYPPWDALEILKSHPDGRPVGGFCQQYNIVFLQACESYGLAGRAVSLGQGNRTDTFRSGHEVVEIWSNEFRKWIYIDGQHAWYFTDGGSDVPLSLLELRQRQLASLHDEPHAPVRLVRIANTGQEWNSLRDSPPFLELRMIPRSNFLQAQSPLPLNQGMRGWFWTGHYVWTDQQQPAAPLYGNRVSNRRNWEWTLNQTRYTLETTETSGVLRVHLDTETPHFETFLAQTDGQDRKPVESGFLWTLHEGTNRLEVQSRNNAGHDGSASRIVLEYKGRKGRSREE